MIEDFKSLLVTGGTDRDACELCGVAPSTFYHWLQVGKAVKGLEPMPANAPESEERRDLCLVFLDTVTRARATARLNAIKAIKAAIDGAKGKETTVIEFEETRLKRDGTEYIYRRKSTSNKTIDLVPNPQIALEYLARRDKAEWSPRSETMSIDFNLEVIRAIQAGEVDYSTLMEEFHNEAQVLAWFREAGVKPAPDQEAEPDE